MHVWHNTKLTGMCPKLSLGLLGNRVCWGVCQGVEVPLLRQLLEALDPVMRRAEGQLLPAADADSIEVRPVVEVLTKALSMEAVTGSGQCA